MGFFCDVFSDKLNLILLVLALVFLFLAVIGVGQITEALGLIFVLTLISVINISTGLKSQKYTKRMADMISEHYCNVIRNGSVQTISTKEVVVDDIILIETGDTICADGYIISGHVEVDNSILNGETKLCKKSPIENYVYNYEEEITGAKYTDKNSLFSGTNVQSGRGKMIVKRVGLQTENGKILSNVNDISAPKTSLDIQLEKLATQISKLGIIGAFVVGVILFVSDMSSLESMLASGGYLSVIISFLSAFTVALTIVAAAVPEGLPLIINLIIAQNSKKLVKQNVLAKYANKIPEAGNINILCTDKTGTLTYANLIPVHNYIGSGKEIGFSEDVLPIKMFKENIVLNSGAVYDNSGNVTGGSFSSRALLKLIPYNDRLFETVKENIKITDEDPFDSVKKYSAVQTEINEGNILTYYMGAPLLSKNVMKQIIASVIGFFLVFVLFSLPDIKSIFLNEAQLQTARFALLVFVAMLNGFNIRTDHINPLDGITKNINFLIVAFAVLVGTVIIVNFAGSFLNAVPLGFNQWMCLILLSAVIIPFGMLIKSMKILKR